MQTHLPSAEVSVAALKCFLKFGAASILLSKHCDRSFSKLASHCSDQSHFTAFLVRRCRGLESSLHVGSLSLCWTKRPNTLRNSETSSGLTNCLRWAPSCVGPFLPLDTQLSSKKCSFSEAKACLRSLEGTVSFGTHLYMCYEGVG